MFNCEELIVMVTTKYNKANGECHKLDIFKCHITDWSENKKDIQKY